MEYRLGELASASGAELRGDPGLLIRGLAPLSSAGPAELSFLANPAYRSYLATTCAAAVILHPAMADASPVATLVSPDPYLAFARLSRLFDDTPRPEAGVDAGARVDASARVDPRASVGAGCVLEEDVEIGAGTVLGPGCHIGRGSRIGQDCRLWSNVVVYHGVRLGDRVTVHAGSVIGSDGFGYAASEEGWLRIAQLGGVVIGDDVDIGAGTTIDRGTLGDTVICRGAKIDNQVQIAHNVHVGEHTAIAGCVGIAGSARIGAHCMIGGGAGILGHLEIADRVVVTAMSLVARSIPGPGTYSGGTLLAPSPRWRRNALRFDRLDTLYRRLVELERRVARMDTATQEEADTKC